MLDRELERSHQQWKRGLVSAINDYNYQTKCFFNAFNIKFLRHLALIMGFWATHCNLLGFHGMPSSETYWVIGVSKQFMWLDFFSSAKENTLGICYMVIDMFTDHMAPFSYWSALLHWHEAKWSVMCCSMTSSSLFQAGWRWESVIDRGSNPLLE